MLQQRKVRNDNKYVVSYLMHFKATVGRDLLIVGGVEGCKGFISNRIIFRLCGKGSCCGGFGRF